MIFKKTTYLACVVFLSLAAGTVHAGPKVETLQVIGPWEVRSAATQGDKLLFCYIRRPGGANGLRVALDPSDGWFVSYPAFAPKGQDLQATFSFDGSDAMDMTINLSSNGKMARGLVDDAFLERYRSTETVTMRLRDETTKLATDGVDPALSAVETCLAAFSGAATDQTRESGQ